MSTFTPKRHSRGQWMVSAIDTAKAICIGLLYAWIVIGWLLVIPAYFYFKQQGPL